MVKKLGGRRWKRWRSRAREREREGRYIREREKLGELRWREKG